jgi:hypothetical protein
MYTHLFASFAPIKLGGKGQFEPIRLAEANLSPGKSPNSPYLQAITRLHPPPPFFSVFYNLPPLKWSGVMVTLYSDR